MKTTAVASMFFAHHGLIKSPMISFVVDQHETEITQRRKACENRDYVGTMRTTLDQREAGMRTMAAAAAAQRVSNGRRKIYLLPWEG